MADYSTALGYLQELLISHYYHLKEICEHRVYALFLASAHLIFHAAHRRIALACLT